MRRLVKGVGMLAWTIQSTPAVWLHSDVSPLFDVIVQAYRMICRVWLLCIVHTLKAMGEWKWNFLSVTAIWLSTSDGDIREGGKQSKADTPPLWDSKSPRWYLLHVIQNKNWDSIENSSGETEHKTSWKCFANLSANHKKFNLYWQHFSKALFQYQKCFWLKGTKRKSETFPHNSLSQQSLIYKWQSSGFKPPLHEFIMRPNNFPTQRKIRRERWRTKRGEGKKNGGRRKK